MTTHTRFRIAWLFFVLLTAVFVLTQHAALADEPEPTATASHDEAGDEGQAEEAAPQDDFDEDEEPLLVGWMELSGVLKEGPAPYSWLAAENMEPTLQRVIDELRNVELDHRYGGVVIYLNDVSLSSSQIDELSRAIGAVRDAGAKVLVFAQQYDLRSYLLACQADRVLLQNKGMILFNGLNVEELYLAGLLEKIGARADFLQVGQFKGAQEPLTRTGPSEQWNQNIDPLLNDLYDSILEKIAEGRGLDRQETERLLGDCWVLSDQQYVERGLVDELTERDLTAATGDAFGENFHWVDLLDPHDGQEQVENPFVLFRMLFEKPKVKVNRASLAVVHAAGPITGGEGQPGHTFGGQTIGSDTLVRALNQARDNDKIKGVVLRIDSPGGSALASELIWQAARKLAKAKPLYVSVGAMAASGGYYIASAGHQVYATPGSILGSIGVVGGKIVIGGLYEKLGIAVHRRSRGPLGDMFNSVEPFTEQQQSTLQTAFERTYEQFTGRVMTGRGERIADIDAVAQGRLFTGRQAVGNGLADEVGGLETALADLAHETGLDDGDYDIIDLPLPQSFSDYLEEMFSLRSRGGVAIPESLQAVRAVLDPRAWHAVEQVLTGLMLLRQEPVLMLMPNAIVIR